MKNQINNTVTFKVEQNSRFGDFRVVKYCGGVWANERDNNWTKSQAEKKAKEFRQKAKKGFYTMADNF